MNTLKITDPKYPTLLKEVSSPPKELFYKGNLECLNKTCISIVGTRKYTDYGRMITEKIVRELSSLDIAIVSGLARGIDTFAHQAALDNGLPTIAVQACGLDQIYPRQNKKLAEEIQQSGLILSEYEAGTQPLRAYFPQRNRIVSGLSVATIVVEAPEKSGAMITSLLALQQGRELFAVPGDVDRVNSIGTMRLIQRGSAHLVIDGKDIIEVLKEQPHLFQTRHITTVAQQNAKAPLIPYKLTNSEIAVFENLSFHRAKTVEQISKDCKLPIPEALSIISMLEIQGMIKRKNGKYLRLL